MKKVTLEELKQIALDSKEELWNCANSVARDAKIYLHWTAGHYGQVFDHYHINIDAKGEIYLHTNDLSDHRDHTYRRNTGAVGIGALCMVGASTDDFGNEPLTEEQIECMAQVAAVLCGAFDLTIDVNHVMTHAEAANNLDGVNPGYESNGYEDGKYGPGYSCERWDLAVLHAGDEMMSGGDIIRGKANWYKENAGL